MILKDLSTKPKRTLELLLTEAFIPNLPFEYLQDSLEESLINNDVDFYEKIYLKIQEYLEKSEDLNIFVIKDDKIYLQEVAEDDSWYIRFYHWAYPVCFFNPFLQKQLKLARSNSGKIYIPDITDESSIEPLDSRRLSILDSLLNRSLVFVEAKEDEIVSDGDRVLLLYEEDNNDNQEITVYMDNSFDKSYQLYTEILGCQKGDSHTVGFVDADYQSHICHFTIKNIYKPIFEMEDYNDITDEISLQLGFKDSEELNQYIEELARSGYDEDRLLAIIDGINFIFAHFSDVPNLPHDVVYHFLRKYKSLKSEEDVYRYLINKQIAETFLSFEEDDPSIVNMFVYSWVLKRISFKNIKDPSLWGIEEY